MAIQDGQFIINDWGFYMSISPDSDIRVETLEAMKCKVFNSEEKLMAHLVSDGREEEDTEYIIHFKGSKGDYHMFHHAGWTPFKPEGDIHLAIAQFQL